MNPLHGGWYAFWSGIGNDLPIYVFGILPWLYLQWRKHNCHVRGCPRVIWRTHGEHALCRRHHPASPPKAYEIDV